jgi:anti-anti-sigma factor
MIPREREGHARFVVRSGAISTGAARLRIVDGRPTIELDGLIDAVNAPYLEMLVWRGAKSDGGGVDIDLRHVPFITAAGLTALVRCAGHVRLHRLSPLVRRELEVTRLTDVLTIIDGG